MFGILSNDKTHLKLAKIGFTIASNTNNRFQLPNCYLIVIRRYCLPIDRKPLTLNENKQKRIRKKTVDPRLHKRNNRFTD